MRLRHPREECLLRARRRRAPVPRACRAHAGPSGRSSRAAARAPRRRRPPCRSIRLAARRFSATLAPDVICTAATRIGVSSRVGHRFVSRQSHSANRRARLRGRRGGCVRAHDDRIVPAAGHRVLVAEELVERIVQHLLREQRSRADRGADQRVGDEQRRRAADTPDDSDGCTRTLSCCVSRARSTSPAMLTAAAGPTRRKSSVCIDAVVHPHVAR